MGFQKLSKQISLCPMTYNDIIRMTKFGVVTQNTCEFELKDLIVNDADKLPVDANAFFELYIEDSRGNLIDVPVLIHNFRDSTGALVNVKEDYDTNRLVHRFFIYDTISGIESRIGASQDIDSILAQKAKVVRFASSVRLTVTLHEDQAEKISKPLLEITYKEIETELVTAKTTTEVSLFVDYFEKGALVENTNLWILGIS
jgi:hypothetical protein